MAGKTNINGTGYTVKGGKTRVGGTGYTIKGGKTKIGGTGYTISFYPDWYSQLKALAVGDTITIDGMLWRVVNKTGESAVLGRNAIYSQTGFGANSTYANSTLASVAAVFEANNLTPETLELLNMKTVENVSGRVFVPTYEQLNGGFAYYNSNVNRCSWFNGTGADYWASSAYGASVYFVMASGVIATTSPTGTGTLGFRPHIEVNLTL